MSIILQKNFAGKKASKVIDGRFQIMEAWLWPDAFYVFDHEKFDQVRNKKGEITYFDTYSEAAEHIAALKAKKAKK